jgi:hypothetical protein
VQFHPKATPIDGSIFEHQFPGKQDLPWENGLWIRTQPMLSSNYPPKLSNYPRKYGLLFVIEQKFQNSMVPNSLVFKLVHKVNFILKFLEFNKQYRETG